MSDNAKSVIFLVFLFVGFVPQFMCRRFIAASFAQTT
jgi:hypothetical protein